MWKAAVGDDTKNFFILYDELTHMFVRSGKMSVPSDYAVEATVSHDVAEDIADFILSHTK